MAGVASQKNGNKTIPVFQTHFHTTNQDWCLTTISASAGYNGAANAAAYTEHLPLHHG
jgi:hypothetical protein